ncbi:MAG: 3-phosphoshikimate 1-carboxyvinyltransferase [Candidatus Omnitrophica bacterium]|nr:3-phosphoshikimate 1-carboxyvinyltransferase [Candidatus Omnitrophota bacterium]
MQELTVHKIHSLRGTLTVPGDKSVSQRAVMLGALAQGTTRIFHFLECDDCAHAMGAFRNMGVSLRLFHEADETILEIAGKGLWGLSHPREPLYLGNSGTTARLLTGILAAQPFSSVVHGDASLSTRPMKRILDPLRRMGAGIAAREQAAQEFLPFQISRASLRGISYETPVPSAQVKSCVLLAGMYASGTTRVREPLKTRDHTERMLKMFGADIRARGRRITIQGGRQLQSPENLIVPGDISSAAFFIVAALLVPGSDVTISGVGINPTRTGILNVLRRMGAHIRVRRRYGDELAEPTADIRVAYSRLSSITVDAVDVAYCIDELPILCVAASQADGTTVIRGAGELRVKETDRIHAMVTNLRALGVQIDNRDNDIVICGPRRLNGAVVSSFGDHRTAMCMAVAGLIAQEPVTISGWPCVAKSFPDFSERLLRLTG